MLVALASKSGSLKMGGWKKALIASAFFIVCDLALALTCEPRGELESVKWRTVFDGDTLLLADGRRLRLLGVNTPELGRDGLADEHEAVAAKQFVARQLDRNSSLYIETAEQEKDRYGRLLARVYLGPDRHSLSELLIRQGLGALVVVPPNVSGWQCLAEAERDAKQEALGIWGQWPLSPKALERSGFFVLQGEITGIDSSQKYWWLEVDRGLVLRVSKADRRRYPMLPGEGNLGQSVEVRGWVIDRQSRGGKLKKGHRRWMLPLRHPAMIEFLD
ncbi:thermonuclease family protein [Aestuariirhabdus sp. Z084]|uniref:thermonuclease family protein n=1 Tax=Aestuariirhabdus haliotis TaxID=2918751 RepID=UPI00201B39C9|nr:thermonuclease family protein [Aestuariirhabdus haliotis]MCL6414959.1 thermonuclease family protein [Aestuariirhabdus haliotis]MCL6418891.1 thermonuclease family protein [Aestuariirhabdus haliotis]